MITEEKVIELLKNCKHIDLDNPTIGTKTSSIDWNT
jgi:hypothetical protein